MLQACFHRPLSFTMGRFYYAVRIGRKPGVYDTWPACEQQVKKFPNARYKKFPLREQALEFIKGSPVKPCLPIPSSSQPSIVPLAAVKPCQPIPSSAQPSTVPLAATSGNTASGCRPSTRKTQLIPPSLCVCCPVHTTAGAHHHHQLHSKRSASTSAHQPEKKRAKIDVNTADRVVVYTDGCCTSNGRRGARAGLGVYWGPQHPKNISERLDGRQTNQKAEIMAAVRAIESAQQMDIGKLTIYTDSMYTINCMTQWIHNWRRNGWKSKGGEVVNKEELVKLDMLCSQVNVKWVHVPGHRNIHGNEEADKLAKAGAAKPLS